MTNQNNDSNIVFEESFIDLARICVKKREKGPFDKLITSIYRLQQLILAYDNKPENVDEKKVFKYIIIQGLKFKNFQEFKEELVEFQSFAFLENINNLSEIYEHLKKVAEKNDTSVEKVMLYLLKDTITEHYHVLNFLGDFVNKQIEIYENKLKWLDT